jgi:hypothetical protein
VTGIYFFSFCALIVVALLRVLSRPVRIYQYPYFMTAAFAIFILPQAISLIHFPDAAPSWAVEAVLLMACLCLAMCLFAGAFPTSRWIVRHTTQAVRDDRLFHAGVGLVVVGHIANHFMTSAANALEDPTLWTGRVTIYYFFASLLIPGFAISLRVAFMRGGFLPWLVTAIAAWPSIVAAALYGRRETAVALLVIVGMTVFYQKRILPPRILVGGAILLAMLLIPATHSYRILADSKGLGGLEQLDLIGNFNQYLNESSILELRNAAMIIDVTSLLGSYEYGAAYWNELVWRFVPAQLVGADVKEALTMRIYEETLEYNLWRVGYVMPTGSTVTGIGDAFLQFGYLGSLFFLVLGIGVRSLWAASLRPDSAFAQLLYICTMTSAMRAVTHGTADYLPGLVFYLLFLGLAVFYARERRLPRQRPAPRHRPIPARQ